MTRRRHVDVVSMWVPGLHRPAIERLPSEYLSASPGRWSQRGEPRNAGTRCRDLAAIGAVGCALAPRCSVRAPASHSVFHFVVAGIDRVDIDNTEHYVAALSKWYVAGSWRVRVINGTMYLKMISAQAHWAERSNVLRVLLAAVRSAGPPSQGPSNGSRAHGVSPSYGSAHHMAGRMRTIRAEHRSSVALPSDVDIVYMHNDNDITPYKTRQFEPGSNRSSYLPLLTNSHMPGRPSIPVPDFSWAGWSTHTPPWCQLYKTIAAAGTNPWHNRTDAAFFSGGLGTGGDRRRLRGLAMYKNGSETEVGKEFLHVRDVAPQFFTPARGAWKVKKGRAQILPMTEPCRYRYSLSIPGYGYSNRLKSLLLCGGVVIHKVHPSAEFFMPLLEDGHNIVMVKKIADIIPAVQMLRANASHARRIANAGRNLALSQLHNDRVLDYWRALLRSYSSVQRGRAAPLTPDYVRIDSAEDIARVTGQCASCTETQPGQAGSPTATQPNGTSMPNGTTTSDDRCPNASSSLPPTQRPARCCKGWDCATSGSICARTGHIPPAGGLPRNRVRYDSTRLVEVHDKR